jgi:hypothetical protein
MSIYVPQYNLNSISLISLLPNSLSRRCPLLPHQGIKIRSQDMPHYHEISGINGVRSRKAGFLFFKICPHVLLVSHLIISLKDH